MGQVCAGESCNSMDNDTAAQEVIKGPAKQEVLPEPVPTEAETPTAAPAAAAPPAGRRTLTVEIVGARGLRNADWWPGYGKSDCYCILKCKGQAVHTTKVIADCLEPQWRETVEGIDWEDGQSLEFHIFDKDVVTSNFLGKVVLESQKFETVGFNDEVEVAEAGQGIKAFLRLKLKFTGKEYPPEPLKTFEIEIGKGDSSTWGLDLDAQDPKIIAVCLVKAGPFQLYNERCPPKKQLLENDFIKSIDGIEGNTQAMLTQFKMEKQVKLVIVRSTEITVCLDVGGPSASLGLTHPAKPMGNHLVILKVLDSGAVPDYNKRVKDDALKIVEGDRIVAVKGVKGVAQILDELTKTKGKMQITLVRQVPLPVQ